MTDFSGEYIELCRKLALPREWRPGDIYAAPQGVGWELPTREVELAGVGAWLPREGDWLDLLEAEGGHHIEIIGMDDHSYACTLYAHTLFRLDEDGEPIRKWTYEGAPDDRKLAICRLYVAVKHLPALDALAQEGKK